MNLQELPIIAWLLQHTKLIPFFDLEIKDDSKEKQILALIGKLTHFYNYQLIPFKLDQPHFTSLERYMLNESIFYSHIHFFLQKKIYKSRKIDHHKSIEMFNEMIDALDQTMKKNPTCPIICDEQQLYSMFLQDSERTRYLVCKDNYIVSNIKYEEYDGLEKQAKIIENTMINMKNKMLPKATYFPVDENQESFNQLIFHPSFIFKQKVDILLNENTLIDVGSFSQKCVDLMQEIIMALKITDPDDVLVFSTSYFRSIFDAAYEINPRIFDMPEKSLILEYTPRITVKMTGASIPFLPSYEETDTFYDIIHKHPNLTYSSDELMLAAFSNSPLDILGHVHFALNHIRIYVNEIDTEMSQSFDVIFGLFLIVFLGTELPKPELMFLIVDQFAPKKGLSGSLEYAASTLTATRLQCNDIIKRLSQQNS